MNRLLVSLALLLGLSAQAQLSKDNKNLVPLLDLEMTSEEYAPYLRRAAKLKGVDEPSIAEALRLGQRLSSWIADENSRRPADRRLRLTSATTRSGIPIETPSQYNPAIVQTKLDAAMAAMPQEMRDVLTQRVPFPSTLPIEEARFVTLGRALDRVYQTAARWKSLKPYVGYYTMAKARDVRGYYFLKKNGWTADRLNGFSTLEASTQKQVREWLLTLCQNSENEATCSGELSSSISKNTVGHFLARYWNAGEANWNSFFEIPVDFARSDIVWSSSSPAVATVPFNNPGSQRIESYLRDNIEDEWKWTGWNLRLQFGSFANGPRVEFQTGVVPHVNGLGGNIITMDENQSVEEYESKWTIRHEFGHVLGFPDCYHEFYDTESQSFINYQLDTTDLMCSRAGNMKERLYLELKRVYSK